jgi:uncharacterized protein (TIGR01244 family)
MKQNGVWFQAFANHLPASESVVGRGRMRMNELALPAFNRPHDDTPPAPPSPISKDGLMAAVRPVTPAFAVAGQLRPEELADLRGRYGLLINNRPDGEEPGQPSSSQMEAAARAAGLAYAFVPVTGAPGADQVQAVREAVAGAQGPVLAFCRTGTRSIVTWALGQALDGRPVETLTAEGAEAGYDLGPPLSALSPRPRG